ncbi:MAG: hypothetical protein Pg6B_06930 [Candidatus Azobacteroides pseudotrichonymphae]|jgi:hypothetical protein|nr:MAG: hypothetical protein Pg6B_06930 [Candidatus Azobacteroides pseudotrichonymphae]
MDFYYKWIFIFVAYLEVYQFICDEYFRDEVL